MLVAHNKYLEFGIGKLIALWVPPANDADQWQNDKPKRELEEVLLVTHKLLERVLNAIPMAFDATLTAIETAFPYYKRPTHMVVGYVHNLLILLGYKSMFTEYVIELIMQK